MEIFTKFISNCFVAFACVYAFKLCYSVSCAPFQLIFHNQLSSSRTLQTEKPVNPTISSHSFSTETKKRSSDVSKMSAIYAQENKIEELDSNELKQKSLSNISSKKENYNIITTTIIIPIIAKNIELDTSNKINESKVVFSNKHNISKNYIFTNYNNTENHGINMSILTTNVIDSFSFFNKEPFNIEGNFFETEDFVTNANTLASDINKEKYTMEYVNFNKVSVLTNQSMPTANRIVWLPTMTENSLEIGQPVTTRPDAIVTLTITESDIVDENLKRTQRTPYEATLIDDKIEFDNGMKSESTFLPIDIPITPLRLILSQLSTDKNDADYENKIDDGFEQVKLEEDANWSPNHKHIQNKFIENTKRQQIITPPTQTTLLDSWEKKYRHNEPTRTTHIEINSALASHKFKVPEIVLFPNTTFSAIRTEFMAKRTKIKNNISTMNMKPELPSPKIIISRTKSVTPRKKTFVTQKLHLNNESDKPTATIPFKIKLLKKTTTENTITTEAMQSKRIQLNTKNSITRSTTVSNFMNSIIYLSNKTEEQTPAPGFKELQKLMARFIEAKKYRNRTLHKYNITNQVKTTTQILKNITMVPTRNLFRMGHTEKPVRTIKLNQVIIKNKTPSGHTSQSPPSRSTTSKTFKSKIIIEHYGYKNLTNLNSDNLKNFLPDNFQMGKNYEIAAPEDFLANLSQPVLTKLKNMVMREMLENKNISRSINLNGTKIPLLREPHSSNVGQTYADKLKHKVLRENVEGKLDDKGLKHGIVQTILDNAGNYRTLLNKGIVTKNFYDKPMYLIIPLPYKNYSLYGHVFVFLGIALTFLYRCLFG